MGFGAGFGSASYRRSAAFKDLIEKFPDPPTAEAEQLARSGATRGGRPTMIRTPRTHG